MRAAGAVVGITIALCGAEGSGRGQTPDTHILDNRVSALNPNAVAAGNLVRLAVLAGGGGHAQTGLIWRRPAHDDQ